MLMRYFETLKETMKVYVRYEEEGWPAQNLVNSNYFLELYIIQYRFIQDAFRSFVSSLKEATNGEFQSIIDTRMAAFIIFIIALGIAYLILWTPFVNNLNREVIIFNCRLTLSVDLADKVDADDHPDRGDPEDPADTGVPPQPDLLSGQGRRLLLRSRGSQLK